MAATTITETILSFAIQTHPTPDELDTWDAGRIAKAIEVYSVRLAKGGVYHILGPSAAQKLHDASKARKLAA